MLAGLIFAVQDADDRPGMLAATLPFAGMTVIEYQARLLIAAGALPLGALGPLPALAQALDGDLVAQRAAELVEGQAFGRQSRGPLTSTPSTA